MNNSFRKLTDMACIPAGIFLCVLSVVCLLFSSRKLTYLEYRMDQEIHKTTIEYQNQEAEVLSFADPDGSAAYDIINEIILDFKAGTSLPANAKLCDTSGKILGMAGKEVITDSAAPGSDADSQSNADTQKNARIRFHIPFIRRSAHPEKCCLLLLNADGHPVNPSDIAACTWYGGDRDFFWRGICLFGIVFSAVYLLRCIRLYRKGKYVSRDGLASAMLLTGVSFAILSVLASELNPTIMDENDNIIAGMLMTRHGTVIYRDYVSQHMPFVYWLCGVFSALGAKAFGQFRLLFALVQSIVWGLMFYRYHGRRFAPAIALYAVFAGPASYRLIIGNAGQILSDNVQATAMAVLLLELMAYYEDHRLSIDRAVIVSLCIFASVGSAFLAVYAIFACAIAVLAEEIMYHRKHREQAADLVRRYVPAALAILFPWLAAAVFLGMKGALKDAWDMAFRFNVEVYTKYGMPGGNALEPFYSGIINIVRLLKETAGAVRQGNVIAPRVIESIMILMTAAALIVSLFRRGLIRTLGIFFFIETQATRQAVQFHSIMLWQVVLLYLVSEFVGASSEAGRSEEDSAGTARTPVFSPVLSGLTVLLLLAAFVPSYIKLVGDVLHYRVTPVPPSEISAVNSTEQGDEIFLDAGMLQTDYIFYRDRYPLTRLCWTLPWYYEWYGSETVEALRSEKPEAALYKPELTVWGISGFSKETDEIIAADYERVGELDLFIRKTQGDE